VTTLTLAATHHDPEGRMVAQIDRMLPALRRIFAAIAIHATDETPDAHLGALRAAGALIQRAPTEGHAWIGRARRGAVALGLQHPGSHMLFCDLDRALHWAEFYQAELVETAAWLAAHDFTVLGRTPRAFASHPQTQRDTESIVNAVFARASGELWDITAAARGLSRAAAQAIVDGCDEASVGTDAAWPLFLMRRGGLRLSYRETEGLEFETLDRYEDQAEALGGRDAWMARLDGSIREWALRLDIARAEVAAMAPYQGQT
jgi:hypothetical protein